MTNENKDVIRVQVNEALLSSTLRAGMLGFATDTNRMAYKRLSDSGMKYWSDDSLQMLLAGAQTVTGNKTYSGTSQFNNSVTVNASFNSQKTALFTGNVDLGAGFANLAAARAAQDDLTNINRVQLKDTASSDNHFSFSNLIDGQVIFASNYSGCSIAYIDSDPTNQVSSTEITIALGESAILMYADGYLQKYTDA
jgi:hypothetical protein